MQQNSLRANLQSIGRLRLQHVSHNQTHQQIEKLKEIFCESNKTIDIIPKTENIFKDNNSYKKDFPIDRCKAKLQQIMDNYDQQQRQIKRHEESITQQPTDQLLDNMMKKNKDYFNHIQGQCKCGVCTCGKCKCQYGGKSFQTVKFFVPNWGKKSDYKTNYVARNVADYKALFFKPKESSLTTAKTEKSDFHSLYDDSYQKPQNFDYNQKLYTKNVIEQPVLTEQLIQPCSHYKREFLFWKNPPLIIANRSHFTNVQQSIPFVGNGTIRSV